MTRADARRVSDYLGHVLEAIDNIQAYTEGLVRESLPSLRAQIAKLLHAAA